MLDEWVDQVKIGLIRLKWTFIPVTYNIFFCLISLGGVNGSCSHFIRSNPE